MNTSWFIPHVIDKIGDRRQNTYGMVDVTGTISRFVFWPARLSNSTLQSLTR